MEALFTGAQTFSNLHAHRKRNGEKMWCLYTMEYYTAIRQNESMPSAATRRDPEIIPLSEANHKKKDKYHMISLMWNQKCDSRSVTSESLGPHGL